MCRAIRSWWLWKITASGSNLAVPAGFEIIDLGSGTLLPGLIDMHTHVTSQPTENYYADIFRRSAIDEAVTANIYAKRTLEDTVSDVTDKFGDTLSGFLDSLGGKRKKKE